MKVVRSGCPAPIPKPIAIAKKRYTSSSGSLMGVLNLTMDNAPTRPRDKASEDFTTMITKKTTPDKIGIIEAI